MKSGEGRQLVKALCAPRFFHSAHSTTWVSAVRCVCPKGAIPACSPAPKMGNWEPARSAEKMMQWVLAGTASSPAAWGMPAGGIGGRQCGIGCPAPQQSVLPCSKLQHAPCLPPCWEQVPSLTSARVQNGPVHVSLKDWEGVHVAHSGVGAAARRRQLQSDRNVPQVDGRADDKGLREEEAWR